jgi:hypothetical protein
VSTSSYIFGIVSALLALVIVIEMLRRRRLRERHAIWWLFAGTMALIVGIFPGILSWVSDIVGIEVPTNLIFFVSLAILVLVCLQHSAELTELESENRALAESVVLQDLRLEALEASLERNPDPPSNPNGRENGRERPSRGDA